MDAIWTITRKDLQLLVRDKRALTLLVLLPLLFIAVIGMSTGQFVTTEDQPHRSKIGVVDLDQSEVSANAIAKLREHKELAVELFPNHTAADAVLQAGDLTALIVLGDQMQEKVDELTMRDLLGGEEGAMAGGSEAIDVSLQVGKNIGEEGLLKYFLYGELYRTIFPDVARRNALFRPYLPKEKTEPVEEPAAVADTEPPPAPAKTPNPIYSFLVPGFTVMFVFFLISIMARSFIAERDAGTLRRLQLAPIAPAEILIGKTLPFYVTSVLQCALLFLCGRLLFSMSWGPQPVMLIPVILCTSAAATCLGLLLSTLVRTDQQVSSYGTALVLVLGGLSGCFIPRAWLPQAMKTVSLGTPHAWALQAFDAVLTPASVDAVRVFDCCAALLGFAAAFFVVGWMRFRAAPA